MKQKLLQPLMALSLTPLLGVSFPAPQDPPNQSRLTLVPIVSDSRLEDIQESPDGTRLLTHDRGFAPKLWDPKTMRILKVLGSNTDAITKVEFSKDGNHILGLSEHTAYIWDSRLGRKLFQAEFDNTTTITTGDLTANGASLCIGTEQGSVAVVPVTTGKNHPALTKVLSGASIGNIAFAPDSKSLALSNLSGELASLQVGTLKVLANYPTEKHASSWLRFTPDGKQMLATVGDSTARLYDCATGKLSQKFPHYLGDRGFGATLNAALFVGKDSSAVLTADQDGTMIVHDRLNGKEIRKLKGHTDSIREIRESVDGRYLGTYGADEELKMWDVEAGKELPFTRPFDRPTAADFSPHGDYFWVGYSNGSIRRHRVSDGDIRTTTYGAMQPLRGVEYIPGTNKIVMELNVASSAFETKVPTLVINPENINAPVSLGNLSDVHSKVFSQDGRFAFVRNSDLKTATLYDLRTGSELKSFGEGISNGVFSPNGNEFISWYHDGTFEIFNTSNFLKADAYKSKSEIRSIVYEPGGDGFVMVREKELLWAHGNETVTITIAGVESDTAPIFTPDGQRLILNAGKKLNIYKPDGKLDRSIEIGESLPFYPLFITKDGKYVGIDSATLNLYDFKTGQKLAVNMPAYVQQSSFVSRLHFSPDQTKGLFKVGTTVREVNLVTGKEIRALQLTDAPSAMTFSPDGKRILIADPTDILTIWDEGTGKRLGSFAISYEKVDGGWLTMDSYGRYDASDPSNVQGASYVMEWDGGLESIAVSQFKSQFYEPELLPKLLGIVKDAPREVPDLSTLHLYPEVKIAPGKITDTYAVSIRERDGGGIGTITFSINGKQVLKKEDTGYIPFDPKEYTAYMLPEPQLQGHGNILSVQVSNEDNTLTSEPTILDIGIPAGLRTPQVNLYALCVGVGNYSGTKGDLQAPPKDAIDLGKALASVGEKLLPGRVHVTTLSTQSENQVPTRPAILEWFEDTRKKASSSDIVIVFFAGHGTSAIGGQKDYFFLTPEADPSEINNLTAKTGAISGEELRTMLGKLAANKQVVILDTCHSGAAAQDLIASRSVSGDYQRAWENIKDATGTWLLAGTAADTLSYEASNVDHGMLTYALLEAIDQASEKGLRPGSNGELFVDIERWLNYAANRVESLKSEVGISGIQKPELKRSGANTTFDVGVTDSGKRGSIGLKPPLPIVIVGTFEADQEDPAGLESAVDKSLREATKFKAWYDIAKHPNVLRVAGSYTQEGNKIKVKVVIQRLDASMSRKTLQSFELSGSTDKIADLATTIRDELEKRVPELSGTGG